MNYYTTIMRQNAAECSLIDALITLERERGRKERKKEGSILDVSLSSQLRLCSTNKSQIIG